ncbi:hypothetical protein [Legionella israelensis]|uniref:Uncharacterized protein n=1 Tax=Legionella israelensis TaxID=454 RepID=A0A0W0VIV1_9GAMM|nr:hypothetical protein [Legionella israelensis]KTD20032.1 hypothetical protein Lisr_1882 [Legionella israelensis]QBS10416.1 hypothetical protein E4T55_11430 [Legionella israelensis]SCY45448.1 hypothetical protein SAMN02746069_02507 [Legionella israelensis DSM 19235]STX60034.1 Uncharacterised protein [Legionella israelensis]
MDKDDEQRLLSNIMFGRHVAELNPTSKHRISNPYIHSGAFYHRDDNLSGNLLDRLIREFKIDLQEKNRSIFIPVTLLENTPIIDIYKNFFPRIHPQIIQDKNHSVGFVVLPKHDSHNTQIIRVLRAAGLIASPWEIAINTQEKKDKTTIPKEITLDKNLPKTSEELSKSGIYDKLSFIARDPHHPTQKLAVCLQKILSNLPKNIRPEAIQRIACMVDMANTFYEYDYPKFAFSVYATIHEISLSLLEQKQTEDLEQGFSDFLTESRHTFDKALSIDSINIDKASFLACPAMSGTNAYMLAMKLALKMKTPSGKPPLVKVFKPSYFEFDYITKTTSSSDADIFVLSAGPIVNPEGLTPGIDINKFVKRNIIAAKRTKPVTLVVDATTALYKNLHLDPEVQKLIDEGKLSIIIHESHQKFGMIHTDQAQYGRMLAICSKEQFDSDVISEMQKLSRVDHAQHLDLRVGAYISSICGDTLEEIKEQHFSNGALLRNILTQTSLASRKVVKHKDMLSNLNELYFVTSTQKELRDASRGIIEKRDSFGHFGTALARVMDQIRLSPDASDDLDCLIQAAQIYLAHHFEPRDSLKLLSTYAKDAKNLSIPEQVIVTALANNVLATLAKINPSETLSLLFTLNNLMEQCDELKGRQYYNNIAKSYFEFRQKLINTYDVKKPREFFEVTKLLDDKNISLSSENLYKLSKNEFIRKVIIEHHKKLSNDALSAIIDLGDESLTRDQINLMIDNKNFCVSVEKIHSAVNDIVLSLKDDKNKHQSAVIHSKNYFNDCFNALEIFHKKPSKNSNGKNELIINLNLAKDNYCRDVLGKDRSISSQVARYVLKGVVNFIAGLTLGAAHYIHYKATGHALFFDKTNSQDKLEKLHHKMSHEINDDNSENVKPNNISL